MEKPNSKPKPKPKKRKTIQITYPAPYSLSWNPDVQPVLMKNKVGTSASLYHRSKKPHVSARARSQEFTPGRPDPTAPHLKYGVFRNQRGAPPKPLPRLDMHQKINRLKRLPSPVKRNRPAGQITKSSPTGVVNRLPHGVMNRSPQGVINRVPQGVINRAPQGVINRAQQGIIPRVTEGVLPRVTEGVIGTSSSIGPMKRDGNVHSNFPPKYVFRNINKSNSKELTFSKVSHLDITPKVAPPLSPSFCPTPTFRTLCRKSTLTPTKYRSKEVV